VQEGALVGKVRGANGPALETIVRDNVAAAAET
jgi:hypothetical protein